MEEKNNKMINKTQNFKDKLWKLADNLKSELEAVDYARFVISLLCLKHISSESNKAFNEKKPSKSYIKKMAVSSGIFYIPKDKDWDFIISKTKLDESIRGNIGSMIVDSLDYLMENYDILKDAFWTTQFPNIYKHSSDIFIKIIHLVESIFKHNENSNFSVISEVYEFFMGEFYLKNANKEKGFFTPSTIVDLIIVALDIKIKDKENTNIYDPAAGYGGMLIKAYRKLIEENGLGKVEDKVLLYGQEINEAAHNFAKVNFITWNLPLTDSKNECVLGPKPISPVTNPFHENIKFNYVLANPTFNDNKFVKRMIDNSNNRFPCGTNLSTANYLLLQHIVNSLIDKNETARGACILTNNSTSSLNKVEKCYRKLWIENDWIEAIIKLPCKLFLKTSISSVIWFFNKKKEENKNKILLIDLNNESKFFSSIVKTRNVINGKGIDFVKQIFKKLRSGEKIDEKNIAIVKGNEEIINNDYDLAPNKYLHYSSKDISIAEAFKMKKELYSKVNLIYKEINSYHEEIKKVYRDFDDLLKDIKKNET